MATTTTGVQVDASVTPASGPARKQKASRRLPKLPRFVARLCFVAAFLLLLHVIFPGVFWLSVLVDLYSTIFVPIDGGSLGLVVALFIVGGRLVAAQAHRLDDRHRGRRSGAAR